MKQTSRELLVTTKAARHWQDDFDQRVEELMAVVNKVDTDEQVEHASELMDVYRSKSKAKKQKRKKADPTDRPFEFLVFRN
ncbi:MAG TPA: hypothetical protein VK167_06325 [Flavipsychrobacter sp.]|nr:hypothetical protein [Flavipsychrobacter sp.]